MKVIHGIHLLINSPKIKFWKKKQKLWLLISIIVPIIYKNHWWFLSIIISKKSLIQFKWYHFDRDYLIYNNIKWWNKFYDNNVHSIRWMDYKKKRFVKNITKDKN